MSDTLKLQMKRVIKASRAELFDAWTKPEIMQKWYACGEMTVPAASSDLRVGGAYRVEMYDGAKDETHIASGTYQRIVQNELLSFTWAPNCQLEGEPDTLVTVEFKEVAGGTEIVLTHEGFKDADTLSRHEYGWNGCLDNLTKTMEGVAVG